MKTDLARNWGMRLTFLISITALGAGLFFVPTPAQSQSAPVTQFKSNGLSIAPSVLTYTVFLPLVFKTFPVHFTIVGYNTSGFEFLEHIHLCDSSGAMTNLTNWRIRSLATGDDYSFSSGIKAQTCPSDTTLNTHVVGNETLTTIFTWNKPMGVDEWPNSIGVTYLGYLYNAAGQLVSVCKYTPSPSDDGSAPCQ